MSKRTVLIVEDDADLRESIAATLEDEGFPTLKAANGLDALATLDESAEKVGLILLDVHMPVMGASKFVRELRQHPRLAKISVVLTTGSTTADLTEDLASLTSLSKPMKAPDLVALATVFCGK